ncbi:MAG: nicotinate-nucleotide adenylyltransferase [Victivallales bacterium]|jgi:nicotinate-nucleotide adenylyltransferase
MGKKIIAVFGGTFDPPHNGHVCLAGDVISSGASDKVVFVPAFKPPHKPDAPVSEFKARLDMLKLATAGNPKFAVSDIESGRAGPSFTFDTLCEFSRLHPDSEIKLLAGSDSLRLLHTWHRAEELVQRWALLVYPRKGHLPSREELCLNWGNEVAEKLLGYILPMPFYDFSSTDIRDKIIKGEAVGALLAPAVYRYIVGKGIYNRK